MLVMGSMIGSGIFIVSAEISREVASPALLIGAWLVTGFLTVVGALTYGELAAMMPRAGGQYVYLRESLGPLWGFLYGWTLFLVIQTGTIAAVGVAFGKFLAGDFFDTLDSAFVDGAEVYGWSDDAGRDGCGAEHAESCGDSGGDRAFRYQYFWGEDGRVHPEHFYDGEGCGAARAGGVWNLSGAECASDRGELRR
jgi:amino acid transporter